MHIEVQVALNFVISYLYNKLPRRRVNLFGEELERALKLKFEGHWYPDKPYKGSAYRCLRAGTPLDPVIEHAARESGVDMADIRENLPDELSIWIDPGEVSFRVGEKGSVKIIYADDCLSLSPLSHGSHGSSGCSSDDGGMDMKELARSFNPEAQCFKPIESVTASMANLSVVTPSVSMANCHNNNNGNNNAASPLNAPFNAPSPTSFKNANNNSSSVVHNQNNNANNQNNVNNNCPPAAVAPAAFTSGKHLTPLTFTTATFAQTKFGSTKLKSASKRSNRMSPTEFSNYIKQRAMLQQQGPMFAGPASPQPQRPRSLSPMPDQLVFVPNQQQFSGLFDNSYLRDLIVVGPQQPGASGAADNATAAPFLMTGINDNSKNLRDGINFNLNNMPYSSQHLLVAN